MTDLTQSSHIKAIIGLGNPGQQYHHNRHNIGFRVLDALCEKYNGSWHAKNFMETADITFNGNSLVLIKPDTFMNNSGKVIPGLAKRGIRANNILLVHDELELPFGAVKSRFGGSAKGHNGLRSIIEQLGLDFFRVRIGIGRPASQAEVPAYVLRNFSETDESVNDLIANAVQAIEDLLLNQG